jgi:hypothetical protein
MKKPKELSGLKARLPEKKAKNIKELFDEYESEARREILRELQELYAPYNKNIVYKPNPFLEMLKKHKK